MIMSIAWSATPEDLKLGMTIIILLYFINTVITSSLHFPKLTRNRTGTALLKLINNSLRKYKGN